MDILGNNLKSCEKDSETNLDDNLPIIARLDGKAFHTFCKGLGRPYDKRLSDLMISTMNFLVEKSGAKIGYTQSDEITLAFYNLESHQQTIFNARVQKMCSVLASFATAFFNTEIHKILPEKSEEYAFFDCRVFNVESVPDAFKWRWLDAKKNSVTMAAHYMFGHKAIMHKNSEDKKTMLYEAGRPWEDMPEFFKTGTFAYKQSVVENISEDLLKHHKGKTTYLRSVLVNKSIQDFNDDSFINIMSSLVESHKSEIKQRNINVKGDLL